MVERKSKDTYAKFYPLRKEADMLWKIKFRVQKVFSVK